MIAMGSIEFMMFIATPGVFVIMIAYGIFVNTSNSDHAVKFRERTREQNELNKYAEYEDDEDDRNYELEREQLQYFRNETFDRQQGRNR